MKAILFLKLKFKQEKKTFWGIKDESEVREIYYDDLYILYQSLSSESF